MYFLFSFARHMRRTKRIVFVLKFNEIWNQFFVWQVEMSEEKNSTNVNTTNTYENSARKELRQRSPCGNGAKETDNDRCQHRRYTSVIAILDTNTSTDIQMYKWYAYTLQHRFYITTVCDCVCAAVVCVHIPLTAHSSRQRFNNNFSIAFQWVDTIMRKQKFL